MTVKMEMSVTFKYFIAYGGLRYLFLLQALAGFHFVVTPCKYLAKIIIFFVYVAIPPFLCHAYLYFFIKSL